MSFTRVLVSVKWSVVAGFCFLFSFGALQAQTVDFDKNPYQFFNDAFGQPLKEQRKFRTEGSPYFNTEFCNGTITLTNGRKYAGIPVKLNLETQQVIYQGPSGTEMQLLSPVREIQMDRCTGHEGRLTFRSGLPEVEGQGSSVFYQILDSGKVLLLKYQKLQLRNQSAYNNPTTIYTYEWKPVYYAWMPVRGMVKLSMELDELQELFSDKKKEMDIFFLREKRKLKKETDLIRLFAHYNHLHVASTLP